jgi:hypothetical protein
MLVYEKYETKAMKRCRFRETTKKYNFLQLKKKPPTQQPMTYLRGWPLVALVLTC